VSYQPTKIEVELPVYPGELAWIIYDNQIDAREVKTVEVTLSVTQDQAGVKSVTQEACVTFYEFEDKYFNAKKCFHSKEALLASL